MRLLKKSEVSSITGLSPRTLERLEADGNGPPTMRVGRAVRFPSDGLEKWMRDRVAACQVKDAA